MKENNSKIDLGKGFKRIYLVLAILWIAFVSFIVFANFSSCVLYKSKGLGCLGYNITGALIEYILVTGAVIPLYYFLKWIVAGFKK